MKFVVLVKVVVIMFGFISVLLCFGVIVCGLKVVIFVSVLG